MVGPRWKGVRMRAKYYSEKEPNQPTEISEVLGSIIEKATVGIDVRHGQIVTDWESFAPPDWVTFGRPIGVRDYTLLVEVSDGSAATLLRYQLGDLMTIIDERFGPAMVTHVRIRVVDA